MPQFKHAVVITGSIGSGKSAVCELLRDRGFEIIDADSIAHEQLNLCVSEVAAEFGDEVLVGGKIDRKKLGALAFKDTEKLKILERILHPKIRLEILSRAAKLESAGRTYFVDIPLFFERRDAYKEFSRIAVVYAPKDTLISRVMKRNGLSYNAAKHRVELQIDIEQKRAAANFTIENTKDFENLKSETLKFLSEISGGF
ncbi:dephospho-CoA kinase [uncultured Campylobacter sp.]|uniref:dephospho-CoA kinase n=1 Tax=uncultured Campylobacter sp. TaxID=218934 RepID=UPI0025DC4A63|nr:dephospho-CoA kinase [uncultured Campylobacter sp.]